MAANNYYELNFRGEKIVPQFARLADGVADSYLPAPAINDIASQRHFGSILIPSRAYSPGSEASTSASLKYFYSSLYAQVPEYSFYYRETTPNVPFEVVPVAPVITYLQFRVIRVTAHGSIEYMMWLGNTNSPSSTETTTYGKVDRVSNQIHRAQGYCAVGRQTGTTQIYWDGKNDSNEIAMRESYDWRHSDSKDCLLVINSYNYRPVSADDNNYLIKLIFGADRDKVYINNGEVLVRDPWTGKQTKLTAEEETEITDSNFYIKFNWETKTATVGSGLIPE